MSNTEGYDGRAAQAATGASAAARLRAPLLAACALIGGAIGGTGGYALAAGPWHHGFNLERVQSVVARALDGVGATTAQEAKVHDIVASTLADFGQNAEARQAAGKQMLALLRAPVIDRSAVERLRADQIATFDERSKTVVAALLDAADQLTAAQRGKLADRVQAMMQRRHDMNLDDGPNAGGRGFPPMPDREPEKD